MGRKIRNFVVLSFLFLLVGSCGEGDGYGETFFSKSFVTQYCIPDSIEYTGIATDDDYKFSVGLKIRGHYYIAEKVPHQFEDWEERERLFDSIMVRYGDTTYNREVYIEGNRALAMSVNSISVFSDADYDEKHLAGSDLSDIVLFDGTVFGPYVLNKYPSDRYRQYYDDHDYQIKKLLTNFRPEDYHLWKDYGFSLEFPQPSLSKQHHITITIATDIKKFEVEVDIDFDKVEDDLDLDM